MSEFEPKPASMDPQLEMLVAQLESKFIDAEDALSELRHAVRQLKAYRPSTTATSHEAAAPPTADVPSYRPPVSGEWAAETSPETGIEASEAPAPATSKLDVETVGVPFWSGPKRDEPEPEAKVRIEDYGLDSTSEGSWPIGRARGHEVETPPIAEDPTPATEPEAVEAPEPAGEDDEARRNDVAQIVAEMREGGGEEAKAESAEGPVAEDDDEARRQEVARMVAEMRNGGGEEAKAESAEEPAVEEDDEARREEVARMVAEMRESGSEASEPETAASQEAAGSQDGDSEGTREDVASMVAQMRAELDSGGSTDEEAESPPLAEDADAEVRDEVRRAVEAARAEMASGYVDAKDDDEDITKRFSFPDWQSTHVEPSGPPVIVIKDSEGRVELARVYETLSRVHCDENAALLNYTPHSVTVGLNLKAAVPEVAALTEAIRATFGRACEVDSDGVRVNVQIGKDLKGKDSAA